MNRREAVNVKIEITPPKQDPNFLMAPPPNFHSSTKTTNGGS